MAVVSPVYTMEFYIEDSDRDYSVISIYVGSEAGEIDISKLADAATALQGYLQPLCGGHIRRASVRINLLNEIPGTPAAGTDIQYGAIFVLFSVDANRRILYRFPTFLQTLTNAANSIRVSTTNANVLALMTALRSGFVVDGLTYKGCVDNGAAFRSNDTWVGAMDYQNNASRRRR
jgi:hypothetical protein